MSSYAERRGHCCNGSINCALNQIVAKSDDVFLAYDADKDNGRQVLDNLLLHMDEELDSHKYYISQLKAKLHRRDQ